MTSLGSILSVLERLLVSTKTLSDQVEERSNQLYDEIAALHEKRVSQLAAARHTALSHVEDRRMQAGASLRLQSEQLQQVKALLQQVHQSLLSGSGACTLPAFAQLRGMLDELSAEIDQQHVSFPTAPDLMAKDPPPACSLLTSSTGVPQRMTCCSSKTKMAVDLTQSLLSSLLDEDRDERELADQMGFLTVNYPSSVECSAQQSSKVESPVSRLNDTDRQPCSKNTFCHPQASMPPSHWLQPASKECNREQVQRLCFAHPMQNMRLSDWLLSSSMQSTPIQDSTPCSCTTHSTQPGTDRADCTDRTGYNMWLLNAQSSPSSSTNPCTTSNSSHSRASPWLCSHPTQQSTLPSFSYPLASSPLSDWLIGSSQQSFENSPSSNPLSKWLLSSLTSSSGRKKNVECVDVAAPCVSQASMTEWLFKPAVPSIPAESADTAPSYSKWLLKHSQCPVTSQHDKDLDQTTTSVAVSPPFSVVARQLQSSPTDQWLLRNFSSDSLQFGEQHSTARQEKMLSSESHQSLSEMEGLTIVSTCLEDFESEADSEFELVN